MVLDPQLLAPHPVLELFILPMIPGPIVIVEGSTEASLADEFTLVGDVVEFGAALVGISQLTNVSAKEEEDVANPIAQNKDTYFKKFLANFLLIVIPLILLKFRHGYIQ